MSKPILKIYPEVHAVGEIEVWYVKNTVNVPLRLRQGHYGDWYWELVRDGRTHRWYTRLTEGTE